MVRHSAFGWSVAVLALNWSWTAAAASSVSPVPAYGTPQGTDASKLFVTGDVEKDFPSTSSSVTVVQGQKIGDVGQPQWMTEAGLVNGYVMKDIRLSYDQKTDTLAVGVNFYGIAGDTDGSKDGSTNPLTTAAGGSNPPHLGGDKSIAVAFTPVAADGSPASSPVIVAGVPGNKAVSPAGTIDGFTVASFQGPKTLTGYSFGTTMGANLGQVAYDPSSTHPDLEFTVKNFSKIPGLNALAKGFYVSAYTGTESTTIVGKSYIDDILVAPPLGEPQKLGNPPTGVTVPVPPAILTPEPATLLAWGLVAGGAGWRVRRRLRPANRP